MAQQHEHDPGTFSQGGMLSGNETMLSPAQIIDALRQTLEGSSDLIAVEDPAARYLAFNGAYHGAFKQVFGIDLKIGDSMSEALAHLPAEQQAAMAFFERTMRGEDFTVIHEFGDSHLERRLYKLHCFPLYDREGHLLGGTHIARDITEHRKVEEDLRASEERFRRLVESSSVGLGICDLQGKVFYANEALLKMTGYGPEDVGRISWFELTPPEYFPLDQQATEQILAMGTCAPYEKELITKDGGRIAVMLGFSQIGADAAGEPVGACFVTDLTRLKQAEAERERLLAEQALACTQLEGERQKLQTILSHMPAGVLMADAASEEYILINEQAERILSAKAEAGFHIDAMKHQLFKVNGEPYQYDEYPIVRSLKTGEVVRDEEVRVVCPGGRRLTVLTNSVPIRDAQGRIVSAVASFTDITERQLAEETQQRFRIALDSAADNIFLIDPQTMHFLDVSQSACRDLGYSREELLALGPPNIMPQLSMEELEHRFAEIRANPNAAGAIETNHYRKDGSHFEVEVILRPVEVQGRQLLVAVARDITDRKRAEEALRSSEERMNLATEAGSIGYWHWDLAINEVYWSDRCKALFGLPPEAEVSYASFLAMLHPDDRLHAGEAWVRALAEGRDYFNEYRAIWPDGSIHWIQTKGRIGRNSTGDPVRVIGVMIDITKSKEAELTLRQHNERLALLSDAAAHLLKAENPDTMILDLFEKVSRHLDLQGYMNFMVNEAGDALRLDSYAGVPEEAARLVQRLEYGQGVCGTVAQCCKPIYAVKIQQCDLEMVQLIKGLGIRAYACNPLFAGGRLLGTLAFATTTRDEYSEDDLAFMRTICQYVAMAKERLRLESELRRQNEQLAESDRLKDEFLAMLAHELRNPLAPIRNAVQVMRLAGPAEPVMQRQREIVDRQVGHMARLLDDLLDVSRITRGKIQFHLRPLSLSEVLTHAVETAMPLIQSRHHVLHYDPPREALKVTADLDRLAQATGNLLTNAAKYTPEGGEIWLETVSEGAEVVIRVRDTGIGIAPEMLPRIFELFTQADQGLAHSQGGLGIGLTLVRRLIQMHGGSVEAHSKGVGRGSEFTIRLPRLSGEAQAA